jgi:hypothetical protein
MESVYHFLAFFLSLIGIMDSESVAAKLGDTTTRPGKSGREKRG